MSSFVVTNYKDADERKSSDSETNFSLESRSKSPEHPLLYNTNKSSTKNFSSISTTQNLKVRAISKNGECNIYPSNVQKKRFLRDIFTTLIDLKWRYTLTIFTSGFLISWTVFALLWWIIAIYHGDLEENHLPMHQAASNWTPCVTDIYDFTSCFLFSVETQQTTGYGEKRPTEKCPDAVLLMCVQNVVGLLVDAFLVGIIFAKLTRPKHRTQTIQFSKYAVICMRENTLCLMFRLGDVRKRSRIIEAKVKAQIISRKVSEEGETFSNYLTKLPVTVDACDNDLFFIWPMTIIHKIDASSPLYHMSKNDLIKEDFEIIVSLEGTIESTDQKTQARTSYLADEILWNHKFVSMISACTKKQRYILEYSKFDEIVPADTPDYSAAEVTSIRNGSCMDTKISSS